MQTDTTIGLRKEHVKAVFVSAIIIMAKDVETSRKFYSEIIGLDLKESDHFGNAPRHFECELGDVHFGIYPREKNQSGSASIKLAFAVPSLDALIEKMKKLDITPHYEPKEHAFARITSVNDPDENIVELTELSHEWLARLRGRPEHLRDVAISHGIS